MLDVAEQISMYDIIIFVFSLILDFNLTELSCQGQMCAVTLILQSGETQEVLGAPNCHVLLNELGNLDSLPFTSRLPV